MARRRRAVKREPEPDRQYDSVLVAHVINHVMRRGKRSVAERVVYGALERIKTQLKVTDPLEVLVRAIDNVKPKVEVKSRRVGGATYQVPVEMSPARQRAVALQWVIDFARGRKGMSMGKALAAEVIDGYQNQGNAIKKRDDTHKMAQANRAFAHYRW